MTRRTIYSIPLRPVAGARFQPTGFPDIGAATFVRVSDAGQEESLLVESVQSMANHAESVTWDVAAQDQSSAFAGLPYVKVVRRDGTFLTSSRLEAHRLASAYVMDGSLDGRSAEKALRERFGLAAGQPLDRGRFVKEVFALDPLSLVHGVFFARKSWPWQPKIARALSMFIEAYGVTEAHSGGVKTDSVNPSSTGPEASGSSKEGYGMVPHHRVEFTAREILAHVVVDHDQLRSYGLPEENRRVLEAIIDMQLAALFAEGLRLRTACDLVVAGPVDGLPKLSDAERALRAAIDAAHLGEVTVVTAKDGK